MHNKLAIVVLLFNKEIVDSKTLTTLLDSKIDFQNCKLTIWNNGPLKLNNKNLAPFNSKGFETSIVETINNESLAKIYNDFVNSNNVQKYIFLDDDTELNDAYLESALALSCKDVGVPLIFFNNKVEGPKINYKVVKGINEQCGNNDEVLAIGSGLVIGSDAVEVLKDAYTNVFDDRFYLYGVDTTFCYRLNALKQNKKIKLISGLNHSLSRLETESGSVTSFRVKERGYDVGLQWRYYKPLYKSMYCIMRLCLLNFLRVIRVKNGPINLYYVLNAFISGRHYRNNK